MVCNLQNGQFPSSSSDCTTLASSGPTTSQTLTSIALNDAENQAYLTDEGTGLAYMCPISANAFGDCTSYSVDDQSGPQPSAVVVNPYNSYAFIVGLFPAGGPGFADYCSIDGQGNLDCTWNDTASYAVQPTGLAYVNMNPNPNQ